MTDAGPAARPVPVPDVVDGLEELARVDAAVELVAIEEPIVNAVLLPRALRPRRRRDGKRELGEARQDQLDQRAFAGTRRPGDNEDGTATG